MSLIRNSLIVFTLLFFLSLPSHSEVVKKVEVEDKSFLHRNHESSETGKFHIIFK